ncbi:MAG TPA: HAMP domain-containing sensor histidine kinase [Acidimicrobiia bacterium]|nr:HAMP domain-containing sensor histidine kinase [Acidimicrobiia bacterium]
MAVLFATTAPLVALVEYARAGFAGPSLGRLAGPLVLMTWAIVVARSRRPNATPLTLAAMGFVGSLVLLEAFFDVEVTSFDFGTAFGLMMLFAVLAGTLSMGRRLLWAGGLATGVATWVIVVGLMTAEPVDVTGVRVVIAVAGVVFTTALVTELYDQLLSAIKAYDRSRRLQDAVARCSEALLVHSDASALHEAMQAVFEATAGDYAYIDRTVEVDGRPGWEIVASASRGPAESSGVDWHTGRYDLIPTTYRALSRGEAALISTAELIGEERKLFEADGIVSEVCVPIFVGKEFRGSIGFVDYTEERRWSDDEIQTLWRAADMVGAYWRRHDDAEALRASNESKDRLLASVAHEIRTPLTAIVGLSEAVADRGSLRVEEIDELCGIIALQSRELAELVEDLLVASRADFGNLSIRPEGIDLGDQVERVVEGLRESVPSAKSITVSGGHLRAWADPLRVRQIIRNLLTNAVRYGGDRISVALDEHDGLAFLAVSDDGRGIADSESNLIFERYYRSAQSPTQPGSVGIGLAVSRQLAEMMGGTLSYVSSPPRFELTLPLDGVPAALFVAEPA